MLNRHNPILPSWIVIHHFTIEISGGRLYKGFEGTMDISRQSRRRYITVGGSSSRA
jgi:hypothetical protein